MRKRFLLLAVAAALLPRAAQAQTQAPVPADRWMEIDLYWFDARAPERSAARFWERYAPLYRRVGGERGVILNVGFTVDFIMRYCRPDQPIHLPKPSGQEIGVTVAGQLEGDTAARQAAWRRRFAGEVTATPVGYGIWTYRSLARLVTALRREGRRRGVASFHVGAFVAAFRNAYGEVAPFAERHPEAWTRWGAATDILDSSAYLNPAASLDADRGCFAALPGGIAQGMPVHEAFGRQWGALARATGFDALMLRDGFGFARAYTRYGPWGTAVPDRATADRTTADTAALLHAIKQAAPRTVTMMYSSAATATSDWRANGLDLEAIARGDDLDIFVDQTWAGAWGEVGVRRQTFWNAPILGWTFQLAYLLQHRAVLAGTRVRHYFLTETFDAWESWNTIATARERLRWGIWAWSHAAAKTPHGLEPTAGTYVSWGNSGRELLPAPQVDWLAATLDEAARDAAATVDIRGPTLVYSRDVAAAQVGRPVAADARDRTDEQIGTLMKWGAPILSVTRAEWLGQVKSDLLVFGATVGLPTAQRDAILAAARGGQPVAFLGDFGTATDPAFLGLAHVSSARYAPALQDRSMRAEPGLAAPRDGAAFSAPPPLQSNRAEQGDTVYAFADSVGLVRRLRDGLDVMLWDPPPLLDHWYRPLRELMNGDPAPYGQAAATIARQLATRDAPRADRVDPAQPVAFAAWTVRDGGLRMLAGNLEEGLRDDADRTRRITIRLPADWRARRWGDGAGADATVAGDTVMLALGAQGSTVLRGEGATSRRAGKAPSR